MLFCLIANIHKIDFQYFLRILNSSRRDELQELTNSTQPHTSRASHTKTSPAPSSLCYNSIFQVTIYYKKLLPIVVQLKNIVTFVENLVDMKKLTKKEEVIMNHFWEQGPLFVRELRELYPDPKPHFSTLSTQVRMLEEEGFVDHKAYGPTYQYFAKVTHEEYKQRSLMGIIDKYFNNSYMSAVSALVKEEKITLAQLKELIELIEKGEQK